LKNLKSLLSLKKQLEQEEQAFDYFKKRYIHLSKLTDLEILQFFSLTNREEIVKYKKKIGSIVPDIYENILDENICNCKDSNGKSKLLYESYSEADEKSLFLKREKQLNLKVYACPSSNGWHLSKL